MLSVKNLSIGYPMAGALLEGITITGKGGQLLLVLGSNGIGKSTLLKTLAGLVPPIAGSIHINGKDMLQATASERAVAVSAVFTGRDFDPYITVGELVALGRYPHTNWVGRLTTIDQQMIDRAIATMGVGHLVNKQVSQISDGETQKVLIAKCLAQDSPVIIMDEPTAFLDYKNKAGLLKTIKELCLKEQKLIILSTHDIATALPYCNGFLLLAESRKVSYLDEPVANIETVIALLEAP